MAIKRALLSVSDKSGLVEFASQLQSEHNVELLSTGGTAKTLREAGLEVVDVSTFTGAPELFDGRVKTLHPKVHGGLLQMRESAEHQAQATEHDIPTIDLVVVNLYPFEETVAQEGVTLAEAIEKIDIGGPSMLRSAAKNHSSVTVVTDPADYGRVLGEMSEHSGDTSRPLREELALKVFRRTSEYDGAIANYLGKQETGTGSQFSISLPLEKELRNGDNPHQKSFLYGNFNEHFTKITGKKEFSYTNIIDIEAAADLVSEFRRPTLAIFKHTNPCGVGQSDDSLREAWDKAFETDRQAPFGGVIVMNRPLDEATARVISEIFTDIIIAPDYEPEAMSILKKKGRRMVRMNPSWEDVRKEAVVRSIPGGVIIMDKDHEVMGLDNLEEKVVTERVPTMEEIEAMRFNWRVVKNVKSNAIVFGTADRTLGVGAGQMSRVDSVRVAVMKAEISGLSLKGSVIASDAFFPFADGLQAAIKAGATACIQPGGSQNDQEVIDAANEAGIAMVFTGYRHFRH